MVLRDAGTGSEVRRLEGHRDGILEIRRSRDGLRLATASLDRDIRIWTLDGRSALAELSGLLPTAGEFSPTGDVFWLGYADGTLRRHHSETGRALDETRPVLWPIESADDLVGERLWLRLSDTQRILDLRSPSTHLDYYLSTRRPVRSPDGTRVFTVVIRPEITTVGGLIDPRTLRSVRDFGDVVDADFSPDGALVAVLGQGREVHIYDAVTGEHRYGWELAQSRNPRRIRFAHDGQTVLVDGYEDGSIRRWRIATGDDVRTVAVTEGLLRAFEVNPDRNRFAWVDRALHVGTVDGIRLWQAEAEPGTEVRFSPDGRWLAAIDPRKWRVFDTESGALVQSERASTTPRLAWSPDGRRLAVGEQARVRLLAVDEDFHPVAEARLTDTVQSVTFTRHGGRLLTTDRSAGLSIWSLSGGLTKLGTFVTLADGSWLAYDVAGRYDAPDPSDVLGAHFVLAWEGGLEPIALSQLKDRFYEPGLLAKMLGYDPEPVRPVPDLSGLRLYPRVTLERRGASEVLVELEERDGGGMGPVRFLINGKEVATRRGVGYFAFDLTPYERFLLPETHVGPTGNRLEVIATNAGGDLASLPYILDLGVPEGLRVPEVRMFALCVGVADYVGTGGDLNAPARDATAIAQALRTTGARLLPDRIEVTVLATGGTRPDRTAILEWFDRVGRAATSTDIVFVYLSGHGVSRIGDQRDYFFLTADADPTQVTPAILGHATFSGSELRSALARIAANKQVVILDTCHSGAAARTLLVERSVGGDYRRAWEAIRDGTGTWMLAGAAADQLAYEAANVGHGLLTYALLEAIDRVLPEALRVAPGGEHFVDIERWLTYASDRVESLRNELSLGGLQRPDFRRSTRAGSFDVGVTHPERRGELGLRPPMPILVLGEFSQAREDPLDLERALAAAFAGSTNVKTWSDVTRHPRAYRLVGDYTIDENGSVTVTVLLQRFDDRQVRRTLARFEVTGEVTRVADLAAKVRREAESWIETHESG